MRIAGRYGDYDIEDTAFATGGMAAVHRISGAELVFKRYATPVVEPARLGMLEELCALGRNVHGEGVPAVGDTVRDSLCWPIDLVTRRSGAVTGVVMPLLPDRFLRPGGSPRTLDFLLLRRAAPPSAEVRVAVLARLAGIFAWLEELRLVHGDLAPKNIAWCDAPAPGLCLIDVDGVAPADPPPWRGVSTPGWQDPRLVAGLIPAHDGASDRYALALALYRGLFLVPGNLARGADGRWPRPAAIPPDADPGLREALEATLGTPLDPDGRTAPGAWVELLDAAFPAGDAAALRRLDDAARPDRPPVVPAVPAPAPPDPPDPQPQKPPKPRLSALPALWARLRRSPVATLRALAKRVVSVSFVAFVVVGLGWALISGLVGSVVDLAVSVRSLFDPPVVPHTKAGLALDVGECLVYPVNEKTLPVVGDCDELHWGQAFARLPLDVRTVTLGELAKGADAACGRRFAELDDDVRLGFASFALYPNVQAWQSGHRTAVCVLVRSNHAPWEGGRV
ncbi:hypothetical protein [Nonomuraea wenchangensis]|uniref:Septum formation n=1 Tax=Nonomuraea wenchangensis TaxID=568860 RepID=A0A1I0BZQ4_9ACTN|nr:hypothetical protein [Nonomuraea wenchangensis]SET11943.1 hypothetical protein SAMN05421811_102104 [Nonomuraea wenchangensis]